MATASARHLQETVARCVGIMVFYHNVKKAAGTQGVMAAEVRAIAVQVGEFKLDSKAAAERILRPVEAELLARYGPEAGGRLNTEFLRAFQGTANNPTTTVNGPRMHDLVLSR